MLQFSPASSHIARAEYDEDTQQLVVEFTGGDVYRYSAVPRSVYEAFSQAQSAGGFFARQIKGRYAYVQI